jgi:glycosyltransferase involved in cell wall biosynthesis
MSLHVAVSGWLLGPASGANRRLLGLLAALGAQLRADERVTVLHGDAFAPPHLPRIEWRPVAIPAGPPWSRIAAEQRHWRSALHTVGATVADHGFLPLGRLSIPACLVVHDLRAADGMTRWPRWLARRIVRRACANAAAVVVPSNWTRQRLLAVAPDARVTVVPNGVDAPPLDERPIKAPPPRPVPPNGYVLHVGHLEARKNLLVVVRALARLPRLHRPHLWLVGRDHGAGPRLRAEAARLGIADDVLELPDADDTVLAGCYANANAVVVPSLYEGFGLPALEALAHGRRVLVSDRGALPEVVGDAGTVLPADDVAAWARALVSPHDAPAHGVSAHGVSAHGVPAHGAPAHGAPSHDVAAAAAARRRAGAFGWDRAAAAMLDVWRRLAVSARG